jgi:energy-coupling factor transporter ATP-binding protein EcfA2
MSDDLLKIEDLSFTYAGLERRALQNVSMSVGKGEVVVLAGASGSGKTTLLRCINGLVPNLYPGEYSGRVIVDGLVAQETPPYELAKKIGFLFQNPENQIFMFSVERDIAFGLENLGMERSEILRRVDWALHALGIEHLRTMSPSDLSDGQKQRVAIAGALATGPQMLVLDEPTSLLDPKMAENVVKLLTDLNNELGLSILLVEHRLELVLPIADRLIVLSDGCIRQQGAPKDVLETDGIEEAGISLPPVVSLQKELRRLGRWPGGLELSMNEFFDVIKKSWPSLS